MTRVKYLLSGLTVLLLSVAACGTDDPPTGPLNGRALNARALNGPVELTHGSRSVRLDVIKAGTGTGTVTSSPSGINCGSTCSNSFSDRKSVV